MWGYITKESPYTKWEFWPDHQGMQPGRAPHGPLHKVFVNDRALDSSQPPVQYGSIAVKENYGKDKELKAITVMYKVTGYNPDAGDWFWAKYSPEGKADKFGKPEGCVKMKLGLALVLVLLLFVVVFESTGRNQANFFLLLLHLFCLLLVIGIGYFGGELVFGKKLAVIQTTDKTVTDTKLVIAGEKLFEKKCSFCHVTDSTDTKVGPGLRGHIR